MKHYVLYDPKTGYKFHREDGHQFTQEDFDAQEATRSSDGTMLSKYMTEDGHALILIEEKVSVQ